MIKMGLISITLKWQNINYEKGNKYIQETPMMSPVDKLKNIVDSTKN